jgi:hypothetical protein
VIGRANTERVIGRANTERVIGRANTERVIGRANTERVIGRANTSAKQAAGKLAGRDCTFQTLQSHQTFNSKLSTNNQISCLII